MLTDNELNLIKKWQSMSDLQKAVYMRRKSKAFAMKQIENAFANAKGHIMDKPTRSLKEIRNDFRSSNWVTEKTAEARKLATLEFKDMHFKKKLTHAQQIAVIDRWNELEEYSQACIARNSGEQFAKICQLSQTLQYPMKLPRALSVIKNEERDLIKTLKKHV